MKQNSAGAALARLRWANATEEDRERLRTLRAKPTACPKCGEIQPTFIQARAHCMKKRQSTMVDA
jgi:hypothetical protein